MQLLRLKKFLWLEAQQTSFSTLKQALVSSTVLTIPNKHDRFILDTDASNVSIGAELLQVQDGVEKVVAYGSFALTKQQRQYCVTRRELLALVRFTSHFRHYLLGREFTVRTDHNSLVWLMNFRHPEGQLARWLEELSQFNMSIQHRQGKLHTNADALSRRPDSDVCSAIGEEGLSKLPCGGCEYCQRVQKKWEDFEQRVDNIVSLSSATSAQETLTPSIRHLTGPIVVGNRVLPPPTTSPPAVPGSGQTSMPTVPDTGQVPVPPDVTVGFREAQGKDRDLRFLREWLINHTEPEAAELMLAGPAEKFYWNNRNLFMVSEDIIYLKSETDTDILVVPSDLRTQVISLHHDIPSAAHQGIARTKSRVKLQYFWYRMSSDIAQYVRGCKACNRCKDVPKNRFPLVQHHAGTPLEKVHIDFLGPLPMSKKGNQFILVIVDNFTKWIECLPLPFQTAEITARAAVNGFFARFGYPAQLVSDQGRNFESSLFAEMCRLLHIKKSRTTAYRPSANGQAERMNRTLMAAVRFFVNKDHDNWDDYVPLIASAIRSSVNRHTGFTPNKLMLGREVSTPAELMFPDKVDNKKSPEDYVNSLTTQLKLAHDTARDTLKVELRRTKSYHDLNTRTVVFSAGDAVMMLENAPKNKLTPKWLGPAVITHVLSPNNVRILLSNREPKVVHGDKLKHCNDRALPSWVVKRQREIREQTVALYCHCNKPDDGFLMVQCDVCLEWFHAACIQMTNTIANKTKFYVCSRCRTTTTQ